jgi:hypothetical protein
MKRLIAVAVAALLFAGGTSQVQAGMQVTFTDGTSSFTVQDNFRTVAGSSNAAGNFQFDPAVNFDGSYGASQFMLPQPVGAGKGDMFVNAPSGIFPGVTVFQIAGMSNAPGVTSANMTTNTISIIANTAMTLTITFLDDTFTAPAGAVALGQSITSGSNGLVGNVTASAVTTVIDGATYSTASTDAVNGSTQSSLPVFFTRTNNPYTLQTVITLVFGAGGGTVNLNTSSSVVAPLPAPPALLLGLLGVPAFAMIRRFTRKGAAAPAEQPVAA